VDITNAKLDLKKQYEMVSKKIKEIKAKNPKLVVWANHMAFKSLF